MLRRTAIVTTLAIGMAVATLTVDPAAAAPPVIDPGDGGNYHPILVPADFVDAIDNPYLPLQPGTRWVYTGRRDAAGERITVRVTHRHKEILGITATVVRDTVTDRGELVEDTFDWFAQDQDGNVWYLGEATKAYEHGEIVSTKGSWQAGVDGAEPGIVMLANPIPGAAYRQEYKAGEAEDMGQVIRVDARAWVAAGTFDHSLVTLDWTPLEPEVTEKKYYAPGIGFVLERKVRGGNDRVELVKMVSA